jgi:tetratricopeptide (TPR) repeat protein
MGDTVVVALVPSAKLQSKGVADITCTHPTFACTAGAAQVSVPKVLTPEVVNVMLNIPLKVAYKLPDAGGQDAVVSLYDLAKSILSGTSQTSSPPETEFTFSFSDEFDLTQVPGFCVLTVQLDGPNPIPTFNETLFTYPRTISIPLSVEQEMMYDPVLYSRFYVSKSLYAALNQRIDTGDVSKTSFLFGLKRALKPEVASQGMEDANAFKYVAKATVSFMELGAPGTSSIQGVSPLTRDRSVPVPAPSKAKPAKNTPPELLAEPSADSDPFADAKSELSFKVSISRAFLPLPHERERPSVSELQALIPRAKLAPKVEDAYEDFDSEIASIARDLVGQSRRVGRDKRAYVAELNSSGRYLETKERLRRVVARVVKDKFPSYSNDIRVINDVYVHLTHRLHTAVNELMNGGDSGADVSPSHAEGVGKVDFSLLASDAEAEGDYATALVYHAEVIAPRPSAVLPLVSAAECSLRSGLSTDRLHTAEAYLRQAVSLNPPSAAAPAMLILGLVYLESDAVDKARVILESALDVYPAADELRRSLWAALWVCTDYAPQYAKYLKMDFADEALSSTSAVCRLLLDHMLRLRLTVLAERFLLSSHVAQSLSASERCLVEAKLCLVGDDPHRALSVLEKAPQGWERFFLTGRAFEALGRDVDALVQLSAALAKLEKAQDMNPSKHAEQSNLVRWRYAHLLYKSGQHELAAPEWVLLQAWKQAGICLYLAGHVAEAERALSIANQRNPYDVTIWQYLVLCSVSRGALACAEASLMQARKLGLSDRAAMIEIAEAWALAALRIKDRAQMDTAEALLSSIDGADQDGRVLKALASIREAKGDVEQAVRLKQVAGEVV